MDDKKLIDAAKIFRVAAEMREAAALKFELASELQSEELTQELIKWRDAKPVISFIPAALDHLHDVAELIEKTIEAKRREKLRGLL